MEYQALAILVRESAAQPPSTPAARARLVARAAELGLPPEAAADLLRLWRPAGWALPGDLHDDATALCVWQTDGDRAC